MTLPEDTPAIVFHPKPGDRLMHLEVADDVGPWAAVLIHQDVPGGHHGLNMDFCAPSRYIKLDSSKPVEIRVLTGLCTNHTYGVATTGTITATFSR